MGLIAGISLVVGGVGIVNVMLASVLEQTREIGLRRAVGARRGDIYRQFLITAFALALFGGLLGVATGLGIARGVAAYAEWPTVVTIGSVALSLGVAVAVGLISELFPALRAAQLDPIQALAAALENHDELHPIRARSLAARLRQHGSRRSARVHTAGRSGRAANIAVRLRCIHGAPARPVARNGSS